MARTYGYRFEIYADASGQWRWRLVASNRKIIADSGESYAKRSNAWRAAERLREKVGAATLEPLGAGA